MKDVGVVVVVVSKTFCFVLHGATLVQHAYFICLDRFLTLRSYRLGFLVLHIIASRLSVT